MARSKGPKPLAEAPPEPESSDEEEASRSSSTELEEDALSSSDSDDEQQQQQPPPSTPPPPPSAAKKLPTSALATTKPKPVLEHSSSSDDDDDDQPLPKLKTFSSPKPRSKTTVSGPASEKRPSESEDKGPSKRPKKEKSGPTTPAAAQEEGSKKLFQRVFSEDDEIEILKGMIEYRAKKKADPMNDVDDFYGFIKKSVHADVNKGQMVDKVRRLRKKFQNAKKRKLTNLHEIQAFELSKKIWESNVAADDAGVADEKASNGVLELNNNAAGPAPVAKSNTKPRSVKSKAGAVTVAVTGNADDKKSNVEEEGEKGVKMIEGVQKEEDVEVGEAVSMDRIRKEGFKKMGAKARAEINAMWDKVALARLKMEMLQHEAQEEESRRIMEALGH